MLFLSQGPEYLQTDMQTEGQFVSVEDVHRVVSVCLADAEAQLARLEAKLKGVDLLEKRLDDLWNVSAVEGAALSKAVEQVCHRPALLYGSGGFMGLQANEGLIMTRVYCILRIRSKTSLWV